MSNFLGFESYLINLGSTPQGVQDTFKAALTNYGYRIVTEAIVPISYFGSTTYTTYTPQQAMDQDGVNTQWITTAAVPAQIGFQMSGGFTPVVMYIGAPSTLARTPSAFNLEYSDNGSSWTIQQSWTVNNWQYIYERRRFVVAGATAHAYWRLNITAKVAADTYVSVAEFTLEDASGRISSSKNFLDVLPPVSEAVGNSLSRELLRIDIPSAGTSIKFSPIIQLLTNIKQVVNLWPKTAGNVQAGVTIGGITVLQNPATMSSGNTAVQNLRYLYEAIRTSTDPNFTDFNWEYQPLPAQNANDTNVFILGSKKTDGSAVITPNANVNYDVVGLHVEAPQVQSKGIPTSNSSITIDLVNGFVYYLQVCARGLALATKTNAAYYGPIHACWGDNAKAQAAVPSSGWSQPIMMIELVTGYDGVNTSVDSYGYAAHWWGMSHAGPAYVQSLTGTAVGHPFSGMSIRHKVQNWISDSHSYGPADAVIPLYGSNFFVSGADVVGNDFQIHRVGQISEGSFYGGSLTCGYLRAVAPILDIQDWYKFVGVASDEALVLVADTITMTALTTDVATSALTINVTATTGFPASGYIVIESEIIQYTGVTSTSFTGCTRGKFGTIAALHYNADAVAPGLWFTKINGGALFCGTSKPV